MICNNYSGGVNIKEMAVHDIGSLMKTASAHVHGTLENVDLFWQPVFTISFM